MQTKNSKLSGYLLIAVFVVPLLIAIAMYAMSDYVPVASSASHGDLIHPAQPINEFELVFDSNKKVDIGFLKGKWTYLLYSPISCGLECEASLFKLQQTRVATGRESNRVQSVMLMTPKFSAANILSRYQNIKSGELINLKFENEAYSEKKLEPGVIYLIDPVGNMMMKYDNLSTSKGMLKDIKKLLKISNIG